MKYALVKNNKVVNLIEATPEYAAQIQHEWQHVQSVDSLFAQGINIEIGWDCINGVIIHPGVTPPKTDTKITRLAFLSRFTDEEAIAIDLASIGATVQAAAMRRYMAKVNAAMFIDLSREDTRVGVLALEAAGLISNGRALQILDTPPTADEVYRPSIGF